MKKSLSYIVLIVALTFTSISIACSKPGAVAIFDENYYTAEVIFPAGFQIGDYTEFVRVGPISAGASGNYEVSISYTRGNIAAAATYLGSITHANPNVWREVGRINSNGYVTPGSDNHNFTIDCNTEYANPRFRIRAINTGGTLDHAILVSIKIRSININHSWIPLNNIGNDLTVNKFLPMTNDWSLYVGNTYLNNGAIVAIKAIENGNVGIGTATPNAKLAVNGNIRAHEIKVETANWPDYVFADAYNLPTLREIEAQIKEKGHLEGIPSALEVKTNGIDLGEMNARLLQKIEELTLHLIEKDKKERLFQLQIEKLNDRIDKINRTLLVKNKK